MEKPSSCQPSAEPVGKATYRAFTLNPDGGVETVQIIQAASDDEARALANKMINGHGVDLWERNRFIESYPPLKAKA